MGSFDVDFTWNLYLRTCLCDVRHMISGIVLHSQQIIFSYKTMLYFHVIQYDTSISFLVFLNQKGQGRGMGKSRPVQTTLYAIFGTAVVSVSLVQQLQMKRH